MKINKNMIIGISLGVVIICISFLFMFIPSIKNYNLFYFLMGIGVLIVLSPFVVASIVETREQREKNEMFLEFARSLVESVDSGTPISKSILNLKPEGFGALGPHIKKLANQIRLGIQLQKALETFAYDTKSATIIRAITLIREADRTGGNIGNILSSVANSVAEVEELKAERRAAISSIVMEGYIIFFIFIIIMIVFEIQLLPIASSMDIGGGGFLEEVGAESVEPQGEGISDYSIAFLALLVTQGFFAGFVIGKLSEGTIKSGIKHSFIMVAMAILLSTGAKLLF
ncbi:MAG: type II secretion system F family protein [Nanoarchaeota archaeon]|nr:type II secretion system F family protein [Nanoarchaeota archaeon]